MTRRRPVSEVDGPRLDWSTWSPADLPNLDDVEMWPNAPWNRLIVDEPVDVALTAELTRLDRFFPPGGYWSRLRVNTGGAARPGPDAAVRSGVPYQRVDREPVAGVWRHQVHLHGIRVDRVPLPRVIRRVGDPTVTGSDAQWFGVDGARRQLWEISAFGPSLLAGLFGASSGWQAGRVGCIDLDRRWQDQPHGVIAARIPLLPMLPRPEEFARGHITHALQLAVAGYSPDRPVGYARATDGTVKGHPLRAGQRLRLRHERMLELLDEHEGRRDVATLLVALWEHGCVVCDRTTPSAGHSLRMPQTTQVDVAGLELDLGDFDAIVTI